MAVLIASVVVLIDNLTKMQIGSMDNLHVSLVIDY